MVSTVRVTQNRQELAWGSRGERTTFCERNLGGLIGGSGGRDFLTPYFCGIIRSRVAKITLCTHCSQKEAWALTLDIAIGSRNKNQEKRYYGIGIWQMAFALPFADALRHVTLRCTLLSPDLRSEIESGHVHTT